jgi:hypothetical protein
MAYRYIPRALRQVTVTFTPKPRKTDYTQAKAYHPIRLSSSLLKEMEELADRHIRGAALRKFPLN